MNECDLIIVVGAAFSNHTAITPKRPIIQVHFGRMALGKFHGVTVPVWGEIGVTARRMTRSCRTAVRTSTSVPSAGPLARRHWLQWQ